MKLETLLIPGELADFQALVGQATEADAQAVRWHSPSSNVVIIGICACGELLTWFASPAHTATEADVIQLIVLGGLVQIGTDISVMSKSSAVLANNAIEKAKTMH